MSSEILPLGNDQFTLDVHRAPAAGGESSAKQEAIYKANAFCLSQDKEAVITSGVSTLKDGLWCCTYELVFQCAGEAPPESEPVHEVPLVL